MPNPADVGGVIQREHDALAAETRIAQCPPLVAVNNMDDVGRVPTKLRWNNPTTVAGLPGAKGAAFVVNCASLGSTALWVGTANDAYRSDYLLYLNTTYNLNLAKIPATYDVDHLYNAVGLAGTACNLFAWRWWSGQPTGRTAEPMRRTSPRTKRCACART